MYTNLSNNNQWPKTLIIRNHQGGLIWQVYHVSNQNDVTHLSYNATTNGFQAITLEDHQPEHEETWPGWESEKDWE